MTPTLANPSPVADLPPALRAQRADARRNRKRVIEAARRCMARKGLDAQIEEIARAAGVGVGTVYRHFPTKDDLVEALAMARFDRLDRKSTRLNSSHLVISYAVFCLKKKKKDHARQ